MAEAQLESQKDVGQGAKGQGVPKQHVPGVGAPGDSREGLGVSARGPRRLDVRPRRSGALHPDECLGPG